MSDEANAAPAEAGGAPIEQQDTAPNPAESTLEGVEKQQPPEKRSLDDVIDAADKKSREKSEADERAAKGKPKEAEKPDAKADPKARPEAKKEAEGEEKPDVKAKDQPEEKESPARGEDGKFAPAKRPEPEKSKFEAPGRFDEGAKADWEKTPESVRGATSRAMRELEGGIEKYKADSEEYDSVREFAETAKQNGTSLRASLQEMSAIEAAFQRNPMEGMQRVADRMGVSLQSMAAHIMGQEPNKDRMQSEAQMSGLRRQMQALEAENAQLKEHAQNAERQGIFTHIKSFAETHPRFDELSADIALEVRMIKQVAPDMAPNDLLELAYRRVDRAAPASQPITPAQSDEPAHTRTTALEAGKSISGAPASGSDPGIKPRRKSQSIDDSLDRAFARMG